MATETLRPNSDITQGLEGVYGTTYHYQAVDDSSPDSDSTYVYETRYEFPPPYYFDLFGLPSLAVEGDITISSVTVHAVVKGDAGTQLGYLVVKPYGASVNYGSSIYVTTTYTEVSVSWTTNPYTTVAWTKSDIDNLSVGIMFTPDSGHYERCTQIYATVTYEILQAANLEGSITPAGVLNRKVAIGLAGSVTLSGSVDRDVESGLSGNATPFGTVNRTIGIQLEGRL
jgi:hypothetical protein